MERLGLVQIACPWPRPCYTTTPSHPFPPRILTAKTIHYAVPGDAMNMLVEVGTRERGENCARSAFPLLLMFPFVMDYIHGMDSSSDSDSSTRSSSDSDDDDDDYLDAMMYVVEEELIHELGHEPEPYHAEPGRPRTSEEGMAKLRVRLIEHYSRPIQMEAGT